MKKPATRTPRSRIRQALRQLWLRCVERREALKRENYTCECCKQKQSKVKGKEFRVEVHHREGVLNWDEVITAIEKYLLCHSDELEVLCKSCHDQTHGKTPKDWLD